MSISYSRLFSKLLLLTCLVSICLTQLIYIDRLNNFESADDGIIKTITTPENLTPLKGISVFGWIKIISWDNVGDIFCLTPQSDSITKDYSFQDSLFRLYFISWFTKVLVFSMIENGNETQISQFEIPERELNSWIFVYLGHSFIHSKSTFHKFSSDSIFNPVITNETNFKGIHPTCSYNLIAGIGQFLKKTFFVGRIERLAVFFGEEAYKESGLEFLHTWHPDHIWNCSFAFTECAYTGRAIDLCEKPTRQPIKSILLKDNQDIQICFEDTQFKINKSIQCITDDNREDLQKKEYITVNSFDHDLCSAK